MPPGTGGGPAALLRCRGHVERSLEPVADGRAEGRDWTHRDERTPGDFRLGFVFCVRADAESEPEVRSVLRISVFALVAFVLALAGCGGGDNGGGDGEGAGETGGAETQTPEEGAGGDRNVTATLDDLNDSGQTGTATLSSVGEDRTRVVVQVSNAPEEAQPAHIHKGTCDELDPSPAFPLESLENGRSNTVVEASLDDLQATAYAINVHKSEAEANTYVACGDLTGGGAGGGGDDEGGGAGY